VAQRGPVEPALTRRSARHPLFALFCVALLCLSPLRAESLEAQFSGPTWPDQKEQASSPRLDTRARWWASVPPGLKLEGRTSDASRSRLWMDQSDEDDTIERVSGEERGPRIPEPMVFDLVRPLGARRGEAEVNVLGLVPLRRRAGRVDNAPGSLGLLRRSPDPRRIEWAPEIEYTIRDGLAVEFEVPMEDGHLEAYKGAGQITFGTAFDHHFIHGAQAIVQYDVEPKLWTATWLYLAGIRLDEIWSVFSMTGARHEIGAVSGGRKVELLSNVSLFADVTDRMVAGVEANIAQVLGGSLSLLIMPQIHYEVGAFWMLQAGAGARVTSGFTLPEIGFRLIREF
jgi:hypothetical protein